MLTVLSACEHEEVGQEVDVTDTPSTALDVGAAADSMSLLEIYGRPVDGLLFHKLDSAAEAIDFMRTSGHWDKYSGGIIPVIARQNVRYAEKLLRSRFPYFIIVDKQSMTLRLYDRFGREQRVVKMACSRKYGTKHKFRDNRTPEGFFTAYGIYDSSDWKYTDDDGVTSDAEGVYGPRFIRLSTRVSSSIGIHGTNSPWSPGHRVSHGCIRLLNSNVAWLVGYVQKGTPIIVNPSLRDDQVNREEECDIPIISLDGSKLKLLPVRDADERESSDKPEEKKQEKKSHNGEGSTTNKSKGAHDAKQEHRISN